MKLRVYERYEAKCRRFLNQLLIDRTLACATGAKVMLADNGDSRSTIKIMNDVGVNSFAQCD
jgi:hypothetical protein